MSQFYDARHQTDPRDHETQPEKRWQYHGSRYSNYWQKDVWEWEDYDEEMQ